MGQSQSLSARHVERSQPRSLRSQFRRKVRVVSLNFAKRSRGSRLHRLTCGKLLLELRIFSLQADDLAVQFNDALSAASNNYLQPSFAFALFLHVTVFWEVSTCVTRGKAEKKTRT